MAIDERRLAIEERRIALEESFSKKWGNYVLPVVATICTGFITAAVTWNTSNVTAQQKKTEDNRAAVDMYFRVFPKEGMSLGAELKSKMTNIEFDLLRKITFEPEIKEMLDKLQPLVSAANRGALTNEVNTSAGQSSAEDARLKISSASAGLPDFTQAPADGKYKASDFIAYPQAPLGTDDAVVESMLAGLNELGFKVQRPQLMKPGISPQQNEVRYYKPEHKVFAEGIATKLSASTGKTFIARPVTIGKSLPNGIMEFWLGEKK